MGGASELSASTLCCPGASDFALPVDRLPAERAPGPTLIVPAAVTACGASSYHGFLPAGRATLASAVLLGAIHSAFAWMMRGQRVLKGESHPSVSYSRSSSKIGCALAINSSKSVSSLSTSWGAR